jgi:hypothetical protein
MNRGIEVEHPAVIVKSEKAVGIALTDQQGCIACISQFDRKWLVEMGTVRADIQYHIQHSPLDAGYELVMRSFANLKMHAAQHTSIGSG